MVWRQLISNEILISTLIAWFLAQALKVPVYFIRWRRWNWGLWFSTGGMPSSHSALVTSCATSVGLYDGFDSPTFAVAVAIAMVVVYDAAGIRRQAGFHAQRINLLINELLNGKPISEASLKEVLGHTPREVIGGIVFGIFVSWIVWSVWH